MHDTFDGLEAPNADKVLRGIPHAAGQNRFPDPGSGGRHQDGCIRSGDLNPRGIKAGDLAGFVARQLGGGGGGSPTLAQAGGRDPEKLHEALASVKDWVGVTLEAGSK